MIRLHHAHQTRSMRSLWLLYELGVEFDLKVYPFDAALQTPDYLALHPIGRVPALEIDGNVLYESGAIAQVLCEAFSPDELGRPNGHPERGAWLNWVHYAETISQHVAALTQQHIMLFEDHMRSPIIMKLEAKRLAKCLGVVEAVLTRQDYLLASGFSAADIGVGQAIYMAQHFVDLQDFPQVHAWLAVLSARPAYIKSLPPVGKGLNTKPYYAPWPVPK